MKIENFVELMKGPVLVVSIVAAIVFLRIALNLEFGNVTEVSTSGMKFSEKSNQAASQALTELETSINELLVRVNGLESRLPTDIETNKGIQSKSFEASQIVSDSTAKLANIKPEKPSSEISKTQGYIWIGNYDENWSKVKLLSLDTGQPITIPPKQIQVGSQYKVLGNMVLRDGLPPNTPDYYRERKNLGVVPRGSNITILSVPNPIHRDFAIQYWAEVEY